MFRFGHYPKHRRFTANFEKIQNIGDFLPKLRHDTNFLDFSKHWRFGVPISEQRSESYAQAGFDVPISARRSDFGTAFRKLFPDGLGVPISE